MAAQRVTQPLTRSTLESLNRMTDAPLSARSLISAAAGQPAPQAGAWPRNAERNTTSRQHDAWPQGAWQNAREEDWQRNAPPPSRSTWPQDVPAGSSPADIVQPAYSRPAARPAPAQAPQPIRSAPAQNTRTAPPPPAKPVPELNNPLMKGQKTALSRPGTQVRQVRALFGWNVNDARCDVDVSAFLLGADGKVPGDEWFVFYGQPASPDGAVTLRDNPGPADRTEIDVALGRVSPAVKRIVFVLTIHEAFANHLNFSMLRDAYVRLLDEDTGRELLSFRMGDYYAAVTSMTIGELYLHNGQWKFNPVGNGVEQDMAGQCAIYGVRIQ